MPEYLSRPVLALTIVVAVVATSVGFKDYLDRRNAKPESTSTPSIADSNSARHKKTTSTKTKRTRKSPVEADAASKAQSSAETMQKLLASDQLAQANEKTSLVMDSAPHGAIVPATQDANDVANKQARNSLDTSDGLPPCLPLPNMTKPGDVDASYYLNWAREYCGH